MGKFLNFKIGHVRFRDHLVVSLKNPKDHHFEVFMKCFPTSLESKYGQF